MRRRKWLVAQTTKAIGSPRVLGRCGQSVEQRCRRAAEKRDEVATPDASCHPIPPAGRVMRPNDSTVRTGVPKARGVFRRRPGTLFSPHAAAYAARRVHLTVPSHPLWKIDGLAQVQ